MRHISDKMLAHLQSAVTTTCQLLQITLKDGRKFGITTLDIDVSYGGVNYVAQNGFDTATIAGNTGLDVGNTEATALLAADIPGINLEMVSRGELYDATWNLMLINFKDLSCGHVLLGSGDVGEVRIVDGIIYMPELLDIAMRLRQPIGTTWSRLCRAIYGTPANSQTGCGVNTDNLWIYGSVTSVGNENRLVFYDSGINITEPIVPGRIQWTSGDNWSTRVFQIEKYDSETKGFMQMEPCVFPIKIGDGFRVRKDCQKTPTACKSNNNWLNFKGEWLIPVGDGGSISIPNTSK